MDELKANLEYKERIVIDILVREGFTLPDALKNWSTSKTRAMFLDESKNLMWVSAARMAEELLRELNNDPFWFQFSFE